MDVLKNPGVVKQIRVASPKDRTLIEESALLHILQLGECYTLWRCVPSGEGSGL